MTNALRFTNQDSLVRPSLANELSNETKKLIFERDGGCCCITRTYFESPFDSKLEYAHIGSPRLVTDPDLSEGVCTMSLSCYPPS